MTLARNASSSSLLLHHTGTWYLVGDRDATYQGAGFKGGAREQLRRDHRNRLR